MLQNISCLEEDLMKENKALSRCSWAEHAPEVYIRYHDEEWGIPVYDDHKLFEMLVLESFQAGLCWLTILKKREAFKVAFDNFDVHKVAAYQADKIAELNMNEGIIRNRLKMKAAVRNAQIFIAIQKEFGSFSQYLWQFTNHQIILTTGDEQSTTTPLSDEISKDLKKRGMQFVGSIIIYSYLQAVGVVNDHSRTCFKYHAKQI